MFFVNGEISFETESTGHLLRAHGSVPPNNGSKDISDLLGDSVPGSNSFIIGSNNLENTGSLSGPVNYYIGSVLADGNGDFVTPYRIVIEGTNISVITLVFDNVRGIFPTKININGTEYQNNGFIFTQHFSPTRRLEIIINSINKPHFPLIVQGIYSNLKISISPRNLLDLRIERKDRGDNDLPSYGIVSSSGTLKFNDSHKQVFAILDQLVSNRTNISLYVVDSLTNSKNILCKMTSRSWDYDNNNYVVTININDGLEEWQNITLDEVPYDLKNGTPTKFRDIYNFLVNKTPQKYNIQMGADSFSRLTSSFIKYPKIKSGSLWNAWNDLCVTLQMHIFMNSNGETVCEYLGGE